MSTRIKLAGLLLLVFYTKYTKLDKTSNNLRCFSHSANGCIMLLKDKHTDWLKAREECRLSVTENPNIRADLFYVTEISEWDKVIVFLKEIVLTDECYWMSAINIPETFLQTEQVAQFWKTREELIYNQSITEYNSNGSEHWGFLWLQKVSDEMKASFSTENNCYPLCRTNGPNFGNNDGDNETTTQMQTTTTKTSMTAEPTKTSPTAISDILDKIDKILPNEIELIANILENFENTISDKEEKSKDDVQDSVAIVEVANKKFEELIKNFTGNHEEKDNLVLNFTKKMIGVGGMLLGDHFMESGWDQLKNATKQATNLMDQMDQVGYCAACHFSKKEANHKIEHSNLVMQTYDLLNHSEIIFQPLNESSFLKLVNYISKPDSTCEDKRPGVGVLYLKNMNRILQNSSVTKKIERGNITNEIIGFTIGNPKNSVELPSDATLTITFLGSHDKSAACVFWNTTEKKWSKYGCWKILSNNKKTVCQCNHTTNFAVFMSIVPPGKIFGLKTLTLVCSSLSIICLTLTLACLIGFRSLWCRRSTITCNLCATLLLVNLLTLFGLSETSNKLACMLVAMALHYLLLSSFLWMLMEGYILYQMIIVVFSEVLNIRIFYFYIVGYGLPLVIVAITAGYGHKNYGNEEYCWLTPDNYFNLAFVIPATLIILMNSVVMVMALKIAAKVRSKKMYKAPNKATGWLKGSFSMMSLLGISWFVGIFYFGPETIIFSYIFTFINGLQGVFIFVFHVALNEKARLTVLHFYLGKQQDQKEMPSRHINPKRRSTLSSSLGSSQKSGSISSISKDLDTAQVLPKTKQPKKVLCL